MFICKKYITYDHNHIKIQLTILVIKTETDDKWIDQVSSNSLPEQLYLRIRLTLRSPEGTAQGPCGWQMQGQALCGFLQVRHCWTSDQEPKGARGGCPSPSLCLWDNHSPAEPLGRPAAELGPDRCLLTLRAHVPRDTAKGGAAEPARRTAGASLGQGTWERTAAEGRTC